MVLDYIADRLPQKELVRFIEHIRSCGDCYEELETFFMIDRSVRYLDDDTEHSFNLKSMLEEDLKEKEQRLIRRKRGKRALLWLAAVAALAMSLLILDIWGIFQISRLF